ncbi:MAG: thiamine diphosphokinase [Pseudomonadota bacterium]
MVSEENLGDRPPLRFEQGVTLLGSGPVDVPDLDAALERAPHLVCADGGANRLGQLRPEAIIGDLDSLANHARWRSLLGDRLLHVPEQDSTDFEKCLRHVEAPLIIAVGFLGGRLDHELAVLHAIIADERRIVLLGVADVVMSAGTSVTMAAEPGQRVSVFPMGPVTGTGSTGLRWPLAGLAMNAGTRIGTSNEATAPRISMSFDQSGAVLILPRMQLDAMLHAEITVPQVSAGPISG